jgi:hypothetical protein
MKGILQHFFYAPQTSEIDWAKGQQEEHAEL